jgi:hypothetical protein
VYRVVVISVDGKLIRQVNMKFKVVIVILFAPSLLYAQSYKKLYERKLNLGLDDLILVEHHLSQHPANPNHLLISGMYVHPTDKNEYKCFSIVSTDNGISWGHLKIFQVPEGADPWAEIMSNGAAVYTVLGIDKLFAFRSLDAGMTWEKDSVDLGTEHDHEVVLVNEKSKRFFISSVKGYSVYINYSNDFGKEFPFPKTFKFSTLNLNTLTPVMINDTTLLVPFVTFQKRIINTTDKLENRTLNKILNWIVPYNINSSTFGVPSLICEECEKGFPVLSVDNSRSKFNNRLYYVCSNQSNNEILCYFSSNIGRNWSDYKVIKKYNAIPHTLKNKFTGIPQAVVNNKGILGIVWQDRTDDVNGKCNALYFSFSSDGGISFNEPYRISTELSCMENTENSWAGERYKSGGDYLGFIAKPNGNFLITWADSRNGNSQLYISEISIQ